MTQKFRTVPDTNVILAACKNPGQGSPNKEYIDLWLKGGLDFLYSDDTRKEYLEKLLALSVPKPTIKKLFIAIKKLAIHVSIKHFLLPTYPPDPDDISFLLCADNGDATHLISYDSDLLDWTQYTFPFKICRMIEFLQDYRQAQ
jgi:uncharacterized protein